MPTLLRAAAAWSWRLLVVVAAIYVLGKGVSRLRVVVIPVLAAVLLTALLRPIVLALRARRVPRLASTWVAILGLLLVVAGVGALLGYNVTTQFNDLGDQVNKGVDRLQRYLTNGPFHFSQKQIDDVVRDVRDQVSSNRRAIVSGVVTGASLAIEVITGILLALFTTFFLLYDGEVIWSWVVSRFPANARPRVRSAGVEAWATITGYIRGTAFVAFVDAVGIGIGLLATGVPLVAPLVLLTFFGGFIPIVGATLAGAAAVLVALVAKGPGTALIILGVVIAVQQLEGHVLQPLVMRRAVRLHPLAIVLSLSAGAVVAGIPGAIVAVPFVAVINRVAGHLAGQGRKDDPPGGVDELGGASPPGPPDPAGAPGAATPPG